MLDRRNLGDIVRTDCDAHEQLIDARRPGDPHAWTTGALRLDVNALARGLLARGLRRGDRVAILAENRAEFVIAYLGIMSAGLVAVPVNHRLPRDTVSFILRDAGVSLAIADEERRTMVPASVPVVCMDGDGYDSLSALRDPGPPPFTAVVPSPGELAEILYTSGSTGRPKGVPLSHDGQLWALSKRYVPGTEGLAQRTLIVAPMYHMNGLFFSTVALALGYTIVLLPRFDARAYLEAVASYRCTTLSGIPTMFALIARERDLLARLDLSSVTAVTIGSAPLTDALVQRVQAIFPGATVQNGYGTTEAGPSVFGPHPDGRAQPPLSLGVPLPDIELRLTGEGGGNGDEGVLELRTPALMPGYLNLPDVTAQRVRDGWYDTGDVVRRDADGFFYFVGRADDMFVCGGENVYPLEVEQLLERHPAVAQAAVVAVPDEIKGAIPIAFVVVAPGRTATEDELRAFALREGPAYSHPRAVVFVSAIPVATTHKVDRSALRDQATGVPRARSRAVESQ
jgi:acyl-CoA synthetase (AMP-forming)/AMP-acid ligase II